MIKRVHCIDLVFVVEGAAVVFVLSVCIFAKMFFSVQKSNYHIMTGTFASVCKGALCPYSMSSEDDLETTSADSTAGK